MTKCKCLAEVTSAGWQSYIFHISSIKIWIIFLMYFLYRLQHINKSSSLILNNSSSHSSILCRSEMVLAEVSLVVLLTANYCSYPFFPLLKAAHRISTIPFLWVKLLHSKNKCCRFTTFSPPYPAVVNCITPTTSGMQDCSETLKAFCCFLFFSFKLAWKKKIPPTVTK